MTALETQRPNYVWISIPSSQLNKQKRRSPREISNDYVKLLYIVELGDSYTLLPPF